MKEIFKSQNQQVNDATEGSTINFEIRNLYQNALILNVGKNIKLQREVTVVLTMIHEQTDEV